MKVYYDMSRKDKDRIRNADVWSMENMAAHGAEGRSVTYIGSIRKESRTYDYYEDSAGSFWYRTRLMNKFYEVVSLEEAVFNRKGRKRARFKAPRAKKKRM